MSIQPENNKRIAKNTLMLYIRMVITMIVSLYTSRVVLSALGIEDYGIYGVVGGVVAMFSFINSSMSSATQRFIAYELGQDSHERLHSVFNNSILIHIIIACFLIVICETFGIWFLRNKLVIPEERMFAAQWCFHLSVFTAVVSIINVPYNAFIIAHERMQVFAYISIIDAFFKLLIAYVLVVFGFDRLILYSVLQFIVQVSIQLINRHYCRKRFIECEFKFKFHKSSFKEMASFACYDLYGNMSVTLRTQGVNILLNMFFGPILNAASSIASQVQGAILSFANNIVMAVRPQIVKSYSSKDYDRVIFLIHKSSVICFILLLMISMPIIVEAPYILRLWLGSFPEYTVMLCRLSLLFGLFANLSVIIMMGIHSTGRIKRPSFINGSLYLLVIPISYFSYRMGASPEVAFIFNVVAVCVGLISNAWTLHLYLPKFSFKTYLSSVLFKVVLIMILSSSILYAVSISLDENIFRLILVCFVSVILSIVSLLLVLSKQERKILLTKISSKIRI